MKPETKQRIIGIVVLLAFVALLIPFLFTDGIRKRFSSSDEIPITAEKRQIITQQIQDMSGTMQQQLPPEMGGAQQSMDEQDSLMLPQDQLEQEGILPPNNTQTDPSANMEENQSAQASTQQDTVSNAVSSNIDPLASPEPKTPKKSAQAASKVVKKPVVKKAVKKVVKKTPTKQTTTNSSKLFWSVQVGSFSNPERAQKLTANLQAKGYRVYQQKVTTSKSVLTRILVGREATRDKANLLAKKLLTTMKLNGQVVKNTR